VAFAATGRQPFGTGDFQTIFFRVLQGDAALTGVPPKLLPLVRSALATDPRSRPSARRLVGQCIETTRIDGARLDGTRLDGTRLDGTRTDGPRFESTRGYGAGLVGPAGPVGLVGSRSPAAPVGWQSPNGWQSPQGRPAYRSPAQAAADMADLLPAVDYARQQAGLPTDRPSRPAMADRPEPPVAGHGVVALAVVIGAIALSVLLPVAGTVLVLAVITLLRAADTAQAALTRRRNRRGMAPGDILVVIMTAPWTIAGALLKTALLAPLALIVAVPAAIASVVFAGARTLPVALSWAAGAAVAWYCVGTGSQAPRRQLRRIVTAVVPTRAAMVVACVSALALALAIVTMDISQPPLIWPATSSTVPHMLPSVNMLPSLGSVLHSVQGWLLRHPMSVLHLP
jgi:hypothetical protein